MCSLKNVFFERNLTSLLEIYKFAVRGLLNIALIKCRTSERIVLFAQSIPLDAYQFFLGSYGIFFWE